MPDEFDTAKMAAHFADLTLDRFISSIAGEAKDVKVRLRARLNRTYREYVQRLLDRYGRGKSFFVRSEAIPLYDFFVPLDLIMERRILERAGAAELAEATQFAIVTGTGGIGKSMLMRHLLIDTIRRGLKTPIYLELRQLNQTGGSIYPAMLRAMQQFGLEVETEFLEAALKSGQFILLFDGFDELQYGIRDSVASEIRELADKYPRNWIVLSSRPDTRLRGWDAWGEWRVAPLTLSSAIELVQKLPFDDVIKNRFIEDMRGGAFETHESFLSNPLLLSIMLLTYGDVAEIPQKLSTFYMQAYEALFLRHDALKSGFQRDRKTKLDVQEFARAFAAFCLVSYDRREFSFGAERAIQLAESAGQIAMLNFREQAFLDDCVQAVCLMIEEGLELSFAHRSFQEYFVARFIQSARPEDKAKLVTRFAAAASADHDLVLSLLWEIDPYIVEKHYLLPRLAEIREVIGLRKTVGKTHMLRYWKLVIDKFNIHRIADGVDHASVELRDPNHYLAATFAYTHYDLPGRPADEPAPARFTGTELTSAIRSDRHFNHGLSAKQITLRSPLVQVLYPCGFPWGGNFLQYVMAVEEDIESRHESNRESIEQLLSTGRSARRGRVRLAVRR